MNNINDTINDNKRFKGTGATPRRSSGKKVERGNGKPPKRTGQPDQLNRNPRPQLAPQITT